MRTFYDAITPANIPANAQGVCGYVDGRFAWSAADWARFPHSVKARIAVFSSTNDGHILDVEPGCSTPGNAPGWVVRRRAAGVDPTVYCSLSAWPTVRAAFHLAGVAEPHWWIAAYPGNGPNLYPGSIAHQYADPGPVDISVVADYWPGVDPKPVTPQPAPASPAPPTPNTTDPFQEDPMDRLIEACFREYIGRNPSEGEVDAWLVLAAQNSFGGHQVADRIAASPEAKAHAAGK